MLFLLFVVVVVVAAVAVVAGGGADAGAEGRDAGSGSVGEPGVLPPYGWTYARTCVEA